MGTKSEINHRMEKKIEMEFIVKKPLKHVDSKYEIKLPWAKSKKEMSGNNQVYCKKYYTHS